MTEELLARNVTHEGLKESIAKYWFTTPDKIGFTKNGEVMNEREVVKKFHIRPHLDGYEFVYLDLEI